jgi:hypothetical protein
MTRSSEAEVKPIAELIAKAREFVDDYEPEQGEPEIEERGVFRALADALESQAERIASLESQLKVAQLAAEELILRHPDNEKPASLANTIKLAAGLIRTQSAATERAASLESSLQRVWALCDREMAGAYDDPLVWAKDVLAALEGTQQC